MSLSKPPEPKTPTVEELQKQISELQMQYKAVAQYAWLMIEADHGNSMDVTLHTERLDPLWQLAFMQVNDHENKLDPNRIQILAATLPPLVEQDRKRLVRRLRGTSLKLDAVLAEFGLTDYPPFYVEKFLSERIVWDKETSLWKSVTPPGILEKTKNLLHIPHTS